MIELIKKSEIDAVVFDMDGLLVNSEPLWHIAEKIVFKAVGVTLTEEDCLLTTGLPTKNVMEYWFERRPWKGKSTSELENDLFVEIKKLLAEHSEPMVGVLEVLAFFKSQNLKMGLASASPMFLIDIVLEKLGIRPYFDFVHSATLEKNNKPHPDVYLSVAKYLEVPIRNCIIFEDSINGVKGAVASGAKVIAVPEPHFFSSSAYDITPYKIPNLLEFHSVLDF
jgi:mannitol-1-/sugar-/sorbitol-6-/2-deoxyglucose-6-phosphatase